MDAIEIKYRLARAGFSQTNIAETLGVSPAAVRRVLTGESASARIAQEIAQRLGKTLEEIWPGRYDVDHRRAA